MRIAVMAAVVLAATSGFACADCQSDTDAALAAIQKVIGDAQNQDTCTSAKALAAAYKKAADVLAQCKTKDSFGNDASKYEDGAKAALASAGSC